MAPCRAGKHSYFSREFCRQEVRWAAKYGKPIVAVGLPEDKKRFGAFIEEARTHGLDFSGLDFCIYDRSGPRQVGSIFVGILHGSSV